MMEIRISQQHLKMPVTYRGGKRYPILTRRLGVRVTEKSVEKERG
jgi:hypothetical protein